MNKKWMIVAFSICITIVVGLIATIIVLASGTQGVGTSVSVLYVATDIEGTVSAKYSKINKNTSAVISTTDMVTSSGSKTVSFLSTAPTTTNLLNPTESNIALTAEQDLIITYTFTAVATYYATLEYKDSSTSASNIEFSYALNDEAYTDEMSMPIEVTPDHSTTYSIKLHIANTALNANLSGSLNWALTKDGGNTPSGGDDRITITYANNEGTAINDSNVSIVYNSDKTKFKIVGPTPTSNSVGLTTAFSKNSDRDNLVSTAEPVPPSTTPKYISNLQNNSGAEFYYFCTNSAVVGSLSYNDPGKMYCTSTADSTLESWYDLPDSNTNLYACFMTPNYTTEGLYTGSDTQIIISNKINSIPSSAFKNKSVTSVIIPQSVNEIGASAFYECNSLTNVFMTHNANKGDSSFYIPTKLCAIYINIEKDSFSEGVAFSAGKIGSDGGASVKGSITIIFINGQTSVVEVKWITSWVPDL